VTNLGTKWAVDNERGDTMANPCVYEGSRANVLWDERVSREKMNIIS
jgi:hypothetical protein